MKVFIPPFWNLETISTVFIFQLYFHKLRGHLSWYAELILFVMPHISWLPLVHFKSMCWGFYPYACKNNKEIKGGKIFFPMLDPPSKFLFNWPRVGPTGAIFCWSFSFLFYSLFLSHLDDSNKWQNGEPLIYLMAWTWPWSLFTGWSLLWAELYPIQLHAEISLVIQWQRICLPMQRTLVWSLVLEDPTCHWAT